MPQTYTSTGAITIPTTPVFDQGQTVSMANIGQTELNYSACIKTDAQLFSEVQDLIALYCRATTSGLSAATSGSGVAIGPVTPREVMTRLVLMLQSALRTNEAYSTSL